MGLRLQLRKAQAEAGDIVLLYDDESEALTHPYLARAWAKRGADFIIHLEQLDRLYGPKPGQATKPVVLVEDNGPIHASRLSQAALEARRHWLTVEWLPKYAPELNDIEVVWHDLKAHHLAHQTFTDVAALDHEIHAAVEALNAERAFDSVVNRRISA